MSPSHVHPAVTAPPGGDAEPQVSILLVDDDPRNLLVLETTLEDSKHRLVKAQTAQDALMALMQEDFAAIVLDVQMPDLDGIELARLIKQRKRTQHIPILFLTAHYRDNEHAVLGYDVGAVDYLTKPFQPGVLRSKIAVFVELFRKSRALAEMNRILEEEIAERKVAEERFRVVVEAAPNSMLVIDEDGSLRLVNTQAEKLFGEVREVLLTKRLSDLVDVAVEAFPGIANTVYETVVQQPEGAAVPVEMRLTTIHSEHARWLASIVDITERKQAEEARRARAEAEAANAAKDRFLAMLSHELRTPLSPVLHSVSLLAEDEGCPPALRRDLEVIRRNVQLEARLIDDLLDVARIRNGKIDLQKQQVDAHELLQNVLQICAPEIASRKLHVTTELAAGKPVIMADPARLQQIFWNLLNNAIKFTPPQGRISVETHSLPADNILEIRVSDTGAGIPASRLSAIFNVFEQASKTTGGLGLGLAISKALTELHGGTIAATSEGEGAGASFIVRLPLSKPAEAGQSTASAAKASQPAKASLRVLLVEDHQDTAETLHRLLSRRSYHVRTAHSFTEALEAAETFAFDVLVTDIGLPDGNGVDLFEQLNAKAGGELRCIALSGFGMEEDIQRSRSAGIKHHITKPVEFARLNDCLQSLCA